MTLTQYLNQENPVRMPHVVLQTGEYSQGSFIGAPGKRFAPVSLHGIGFYCVKEGDTRLYTVDNDGNPKSPSCFHLK